MDTKTLAVQYSRTGRCTAPRTPPIYRRMICNICLGTCLLTCSQADQPAIKQLWASSRKTKVLNKLDNTWVRVFFRPSLIRILTVNSPLEDFSQKIKHAKFWDKVLTFHLGSFALKFLKSLTNQNVQNLARTPIFFFKRSLSKSRIAT